MSSEILIVAGEASGDLYGADLVHKVAEVDPTVRFFGMGGDRMKSCGVELTQHFRDVSVMGFVEVLSRIGPLYRSFKGLVEEARQRRPPVAVLIDFPDYNLRLAAKIKAVSPETKVVYYIGPTVWAWRKSRIETIARYIDKMIVIFPFEEPLYREAGVDVEFVGHPLVGEVKKRTGDEDEFRGKFALAADKRLIGLFPGSRAKEVDAILPVMTAAARALARRDEPLQFALGLAPSVERSQIEALLPADLEVTIVEHMGPDLMQYADLLLVASGTAPLEAAILSTPQVVVYRAAPLTFAIAERLVDVPHICMVNLILERRAVPELLQKGLTPERLAAEAATLLDDDSARKAQEASFAELRRQLGAAGAAKRAARVVRRVLAGAGHDGPLILPEAP